MLTHRGTAGRFWSARGLRKNAKPVDERMGYIDNWLDTILDEEGVFNWGIEKPKTREGEEKRERKRKKKKQATN